MIVQEKEPLSAKRLQSDCKMVVREAFKTRVNRCRTRYYNDFSLYMVYRLDGLPLGSNSHQSVKFCYRNCYTNQGVAISVAVTAKWRADWRQQRTLIQCVSNFVAPATLRNDALWDNRSRCPSTYAPTTRTKKASRPSCYASSSQEQWAILAPRRSS